jgi:hypothetical protein
VNLMITRRQQCRKRLGAVHPYRARKREAAAAVPAGRPVIAAAVIARAGTATAAEKSQAHPKQSDNRQTLITSGADRKY